MGSVHTLGSHSMLARTAEGQRALVFGAVHLDPAERTLLSVLTGYTPLEALDRLGLDTQRVAPRLLDQGFIASVDA